MKSLACAITTVDNPYDPFVQFDAWYNFDVNRKHTHADEMYVDCCSILDRYLTITDNMSDSEQIAAIEDAINEVIKYDVNNVYIKVKREIEDPGEIEPDDKSFMNNMSDRFLSKTE